MDLLDTGILRELITDVPNRCLQPDIKKSYVSIAKKLDTTEDTVRNGVRWLHDRGIVRGWRLGVNPTLYGLAESSSYSSDFHDITTGNNILTGTTAGFSATTGYDFASGWGTPNVANLVAGLS